MAVLPCIDACYIRSYFLSIIKRAGLATRGRNTMRPILALAVFMAGLAAPAFADPTPIKIACTATSDCASAMIATYDGIFAKHGLAAEMTLIGINTNIPPAIASDSIQIGGP